jgi:acyl-CoA synthetase (AMP-forming)/AMP-acid ligase II
MSTTGFWLSHDTSCDNNCLVFGDIVVTYGQLIGLSEDWVLRAKETLVPELDRPLVALEMTPTVEAVSAYLGCLRAGWPVILLAPGQGDHGPKAPPEAISTLYRPNLIQRAGTNTPLLFDPHPLPMDPQLAVLLSTSGTTGATKLVKLSFQNIQSNALSICDYLSITAADTAITTLPLHYSYGMSVLNSYLAAGARLVLTEDSIISDEFWTQARQGGVTSLALVPTQFELLEKIGFDHETLPTLRYITQAGGRLDPVLAQRFARAARDDGWQLVIMYGQTEASPRIAYVPPEEALVSAHTIGRVIPGGQLWIEDVEGRQIEDTGVAGELVYQGPNVMMGYALSWADLASPAGSDILKTGDIAMREASGFFRITGRASRFVKLFGLRISLDEIETQLRQAGCRAYVSGNDHGVVVFVQGATTDMLPLLGNSLAERYALPASAIRVVALSEVPLLPSGKVAYQALLTQAASLLAQPLPKNSTSSQKDALCRILRRPNANLGLSFQELGGDSLAYLEVEMLLGHRPGGLPDGWDRLPLDSLLADVPAPANQRAGQKPERVAVGPELPIRVLAILFVILLHATSLPVGGGVFVLTILVGYSLARFQLAQLLAGNAWRMALVMTLPLLAAYYLVLLMLSLHFEIDWEWFLLVANFGAFSNALPDPGWLLPYWYVSAYVQIIIMIGMVFSFPFMRRSLGRFPFQGGITLWLLTCLSIIALGVTDLTYGSQIRHPLGALELVLLGWCIALAKSREQRLLVSGMLTLSWLWLWRDADPSVTVFLTVLPMAVLWLPRLRLPAAVARLMQSFGVLILYIYIAHVPVLYVARHLLDMQTAIFLMTLTGSVAVGWLMKAVLDWSSKAIVMAVPGSRRSSAPALKA